MKNASQIVFAAIAAVLVSMTACADVWYLDKDYMLNMANKEPECHLKYWRNAVTGNLGPDRAPSSSDELIVTNAAGVWNSSLRMGGLANVKVSCKSLQLGIPDSGANAIGVVTHDGKTVDFTDSHILLVRGRWGVNANASFGIKGPITVLSPKSDPFLIGYQQISLSGTFTVDGKVSGAEGTGLAVQQGSNLKQGPRCFYDFTDVSGFKGDFTVGGGATFTNTVYLAGANSPGLLTVKGTGGIGDQRTDGTITFGTIAFSSDSTYSGSPRICVFGATNACSRLIATDAVTIDAGVKVRVCVDFTPSVAELPVLVAPATSAFSEADFSLERTSKCLNEDMRLVVRADGTTRTLYLVQTPIIMQIAKYGHEGIRDFRNFDDALSSMTNATHWSDLREPHADAIYLSNMDLCTPYEPEVDFTFPGQALVFNANANFVMRAASFTVPEFRVIGNKNILGSQGMGWKTMRINSRFDLRNGTLYIQAYNNHCIVLNGDISGNGNITLEGTTSTSYPRGDYELCGCNTNFTGKITVKQSTTLDCSMDNFQRLFVNDGRNLGGKMASFDPRALTLENFSQIRVTNALCTVVLADGLNRGVYIHQIGRFNIDRDAKIDVCQPILLSGALVKEGEGELILRKGLKHEATDGGAQTDVPRAGSNLVQVTSGLITVRHADALAGAAVSLSKSTGLKIAYSGTDDDLARYGIRDTTTDTPFALAADFGGKLPLTIDVSALSAPTSGELVLGLVTVSDAAAATVRNMLAERYRLWPGVRSERIELHDAATRTTTFAVKSYRSGLVLIVK